MDRIGPYELQQVIGQGASSTVWRAVAVGPVARVVAVKRMPIGSDLAVMARARHEAELLAALDHPHIVRILDVVDDHGNVALVMPLAEGGSLADLEFRRGSLSPGEVVAVVAPIADALASAHRRGVVHGDVKPSNILLTADGEPLLADFDVADQLGDRAATARGVGGTAGYSDPRRIESGRPAPSDDVYGLAVVAGQALTGQCTAPAPAPLPEPATDDGGARALHQVIRGVLRPMPGTEPVTAAELATAVRAAVEPRAVRLPGPRLDRGERVAARPPGPDRSGTGTERFGPRPPSGVAHERSRRRPRVSTAAVVVGVGLVAAAVVGRGIADRRPTASAAPPRACAPVPPLAVPPGATHLEADFSGHGCPVPLVWDRGVLAFRISAADRQPRRYVFRPATTGAARSPLTQGTLLAGDWDCNGTDGLAYYDPATGLVHYFDRIPEHGALVADAQASLGRAATGLRVVRHGGCDRVVARRAG